jgi:hypothetical protein
MKKVNAGNTDCMTPTDHMLELIQQAGDNPEASEKIHAEKNRLTKVFCAEFLAKRRAKESQEFFTWLYRQASLAEADRLANYSETES